MQQMDGVCECMCAFACDCACHIAFMCVCVCVCAIWYITQCSWHTLWFYNAFLNRISVKWTCIYKHIHEEDLFGNKQGFFRWQACRCFLTIRSISRKLELSFLVVIFCVCVCVWGGDKNWYHAKFSITADECNWTRVSVAWHTIALLHALHNTCSFTGWILKTNVLRTM